MKKDGEELRATRYVIDAVEKTEDGRLKVRGKLTKTGVFEYQRGDGVVREKRSDEEVFSQATLDSLEGAPVTIDHPSDFVSSDNWKMLAVGTVLSAKADPPYVEGVLSVHDSRAQHMIEGGHLKEISCGYFMRPIALDGKEADFLQTQIRMNHAALGPSGWGRLGSDVSLTLDSNNDQNLMRFDMVEKQEVVATEDTQESLPIEEQPQTGSLEKKLDNLGKGLSELTNLLAGFISEKTEDKKPYREVQETLDADTIRERIQDRAADDLGLELRARSAYETIYPKRKTIDTVEPFAQGFCEEILGLTGDHGYSLKELVERAEISAERAKAERKVTEDAKDQELKAALYGLPYVQNHVDPLLAHIQSIQGNK